MSKQVEAAWQLVSELASISTPEEQFERLKNEDGVVDNDGMIYEDADEMISDMSDDQLVEAFAAFMEFVSRAKEIVK